MKLTKRCEYGIRASVRLAQSHGKGYVQSKEIASSESLPAKFLESILLALRSGGVLESKVGAGGGYRLTRAPKEILVADLLTAMNGEMSDDHAELDRSEAGVGQHGLDIISSRMNETISRDVGTITLADLLNEAENRAVGSATSMYYI